MGWGTTEDTRGREQAELDLGPVVQPWPLLRREDRVCKLISSVPGQLPPTKNSKSCHDFSFFLFSTFGFETLLGYVAQNDLKLSIILSETPKSWNNRCLPPNLTSHIFF